MKKEQYYVAIDKREYCTVTREADPDTKWDADDVSYSHTINGYREVGEKNSWDLILRKKPVGTLQLVVVYYDNGDSFHWEENLISIISLVESIEDANLIKKAIEDDYKEYKLNSNKNKRTLEVKLSNGNITENVYCCWKGYFEKLNSVEIVPVNPVNDTTPFNPIKI